MGFVKLDDGPGAFDDILQAQRFQGGLAQQGFQNTLAVAEHKQREAQGNEQLRLQGQRNDVLARDSRRRIVGSAMNAASRAPGQGAVAPGIAEMSEFLQANSPKEFEELVGRYAGVELDDSIDPASWAETEEGAAFIEDMSGLYLGAKSAEAAQIASRTAQGLERLMAHPTAGLTQDDAAPILKMLQEGKATGAEISAAYQAVRTKAANNVGFAEMKAHVLTEAAGTWAQAMAQVGSAKSLGLDEESPAEVLMRLRGEIELADSPEELQAARGAYMIKAHNLDGVVSDMETRAFEAGRVSAQAMFEDQRGAVLGQAPRKREAAAAAPTNGNRLEGRDNLARVLGGASNDGVSPTAAFDAALEKKLVGAGSPDPNSREGQRLLAEAAGEYAKKLADAKIAVLAGDSAKLAAKARGVDQPALDAVEAERKQLDRATKIGNTYSERGSKIMESLSKAERADDDVVISKFIQEGLVKTREDAAIVLERIKTGIDPKAWRTAEEVLRGGYGLKEAQQRSGLSYDQLKRIQESIRIGGPPGDDPERTNPTGREVPPATATAPPAQAAQSVVPASVPTPNVLFDPQGRRSGNAVFEPDERNRPKPKK